MRQILITSFILLCISFLLPILASGQPLSGAKPESESPSPSVSSEPAAPSAPPTPTPRPTIRPEHDSETTITVLIEDTPTEMKLSEYLYGVVAAEMPALYPEDALRAQAVAARTYALHALHYEKHHDNADICDTFSHCMAYSPLESAMEAWGTEHGSEYAQKIMEAVHSTDGEVITYNGLLIDALFYAVSSGQTEAAKDVWSQDVPYLQSVDSSWDSESPSFASTVTLDEKEMREKLLAAYPDMKLPAKQKKWFGEPERSPAGGVKTLFVGGVTIKGTEIRTIFGLTSHNFTVTWEDGQFRFDVKGYGHGVGLSQFGARQMALSGHDYREILTHYYKGAEITGVES